MTNTKAEGSRKRILRLLLEKNHVPRKTNTPIIPQNSKAQNCQAQITRSWQTKEDFLTHRIKQFSTITSKQTAKQTAQNFSRGVREATPVIWDLFSFDSIPYAPKQGQTTPPKNTNRTNKTQKIKHKNNKIEKHKPQKKVK